jgi:hypothetical protein
MDIGFRRGAAAVRRSPRGDRRALRSDEGHGALGVRAIRLARLILGATDVVTVDAVTPASSTWSSWR